MCESPEPTPVNTTQTVVNQLPAYEQEARQRLYTKASEVANSPYQPYPGPRLADFTPDQSNAFDLTRANVGSYIPGMYNAFTALGRSAQTFPEANLSGYLNPYSQAVTDIAAREAQRTWDVNRQQINDAAVKAGAFGGSRHGIAEAEGQRNVNQQLSDIYLKGGESAFRNAAQLFNADADRLLKAGTQYGTLAGMGQAYGLKDAAALQAVGEAQQQQGQKSLDLAYQNFTQQRDYPREQVNWLSNIIKGTSLPSGSTTTGQQLVPQSSPLAQVAGLATTGLGIYGLGSSMGWFAKGGRVRRMRKGGRVRRYADGGRIEGEEQFSNLNVSGLRAILADNAYSPAEREIVRQMILRATAPQVPSARLAQIAEAPVGPRAPIWNSEGSQLPNMDSSAELPPSPGATPVYPPPARAYSGLDNLSLITLYNRLKAEGNTEAASAVRNEFQARENFRNTQPGFFSKLFQRGENTPATDEYNKLNTPENVPPGPPPAPGMRTGEGEMPSDAPALAPGASPAAAQPLPGTSRPTSGAGVGPSPGIPSMDIARGDVEKKIFAPYVESPDVSKPYDVKLPEAEKLDEKASPWMAITKAGLAMMAAKPGQSALQAIGEGGMQGLEQFGKDVESARKNKQTNFENALRSASARIEMAKAETDRTLKEKQLKLAERDSQRAERSLYLDWVKTGDMRDFHNKSLALQAASVSKDPYKMQADQTLKMVGMSLGLDPDMAKWTQEQRKEAASKALEYNRGAAALYAHERGQNQLVLNNFKTQLTSLDKQLQTMLPGDPRYNAILVERNRILRQMQNLNADGTDPLGDAVRNALGNKPTP